MRRSPRLSQSDPYASRMSMRSRARGRGCRSGGVQQSARIIPVMRLSASLFLAVTMSVVGAGCGSGGRSGAATTTTAPPATTASVLSAWPGVARTCKSTGSRTSLPTPFSAAESPCSCSPLHSGHAREPPRRWEPPSRSWPPTDERGLDLSWHQRTMNPSKPWRALPCPCDPSCDLWRLSAVFLGAALLAGGNRRHSER